jgi:hypothetical protein
MLMGSIFLISITARILHREQGERTGEFLLDAVGAVSLAAFTPEGFTRSLRDYSVIFGYAFSLMLGMGGVGVLVSALGRRA